MNNLLERQKLTAAAAEREPNEDEADKFLERMLGSGHRLIVIQFCTHACMPCVKNMVCMHA